MGSSPLRTLTLLGVARGFLAILAVGVGHYAERVDVLAAVREARAWLCEHAALVCGCLLPVLAGLELPYVLRSTRQ